MSKITNHADKIVDLSETIANNYLNGNRADVLKQITGVTSIDAAAIAVSIHEGFTHKRDANAFLSFLTRESFNAVATEDPYARLNNPFQIRKVGEGEYGIYMYMGSAWQCFKIVDAEDEQSARYAFFNLMGGWALNAPTS